MSTRARPRGLEFLESRLLFASATFQQGVNGYVGAVDTTVRLDFPDTSFADSPLIVTSLDDADTTTGNQPDEGLIRFDGIFGASAGQIPTGATITSATLTVVTGTNSGDSSTALS